MATIIRATCPGDPEAGHMEHDTEIDISKLSILNIGYSGSKSRVYQFDCPKGDKRVSRECEDSVRDLLANEGVTERSIEMPRRELPENPGAFDDMYDEAIALALGEVTIPDTIEYSSELAEVWDTPKFQLQYAHLCDARTGSTG